MCDCQNGSHSNSVTRWSKRDLILPFNFPDGRFTLEHAACGQIDASDHMLIESCTHYPFLDAEGNARVFSLFAEADDSFD